MMREIARRVGVAAGLSWLLCAATACAITPAPDQASIQPSPAAWVVGTYAYPQRDRRAAIQPLAEYLARRGEHPVELRVLASPSALIDAMRGGEVDVAVPNLHAFLQARGSADGLEPLPVPDVPPADADRYRAVLVSRGAIASIDALQRNAARLALAMVGQDSASGGFVPAAALRTFGLDVPGAFASVQHAGSHAAALEAVTSGAADVAALAADVHAQSGVEGLHVLWRSDPIPPGPLLCRTSGPVPCADVATWLLEAHQADPAVMAALREGWPEFGSADAFREADLPRLDALLGEL